MCEGDGTERCGAREGKGEAFLSYHKTRHTHMKVERNKGGGFTINCGPHACTQPYLIRVTTGTKKRLADLDTNLPLCPPRLFNCEERSGLHWHSIRKFHSTDQISPEQL